MAHFYFCVNALNNVLQGPALYVYNDAVFSDADWKGIRMLHESIKEDDPMKVGRFGLGFKSVFHMTGWNAVVNHNIVSRF